MARSCDYLIVGAGLFGSVLAERIANELDAEVLLLDKRSHQGGNCHSEVDPETGIEFHRYGTHIFHTSSKPAWDYLSRFTDLNGYNHQVLTMHRGAVYQMPINLATINAFYERNLSPAEAREFVAAEAARERIEQPSNFEEKAISQIGRPLYEAFIRGYTRKQWGRDPKELSARIFARLPVRFNYDRSYFHNCRWQGIPVDGYAKIFERMLASPRIRVELACDYFDARDEIEVRRRTIYTGPIDRYFDYAEGALEWRSVRFERQVKEIADFQGTSVMNYADEDVPFTRIHEPQHLHPERPANAARTLLMRESSQDDRENPYYPVNTQRNRELLARYRSLAAQEATIFGGRLGDYAYYDMDITICAALKCFAERIAR